MKLKYYKCVKCGAIATFIGRGCESISCCGEQMQELVAGTTEAAKEKHIPVVEAEGSTVNVKVGEVAHPMLPEHYIPFIALQTTKGVQIKDLKPGDEPKASFALAEGESCEAAFAYCNLHNLWQTSRA